MGCWLVAHELGVWWFGGSWFGFSTGAPQGEFPGRKTFKAPGIMSGISWATGVGDQAGKKWSIASRRAWRSCAERLIVANLPQGVRSMALMITVGE
jgi:hypothetical protein